MQKKQNENQNKQAKDKNKTKWPNKAKWNEKTTKVPLRSFCAGQLLLHEACPGVVVGTPRDIPLEKTDFSSCQCRQLLARGGTPCPLCLSVLTIMSKRTVSLLTDEPSFYLSSPVSTVSAGVGQKNVSAQHIPTFHSQGKKDVWYKLYC